MLIVFCTALCVGGATILGSAIGFLFGGISRKFGSIALAFSAGVMLAAAVIGLIMPSLDIGGTFALPVTVAGVFAGAFSLSFLNRLVPHLYRLVGVDSGSSDINRVLLLFAAIAIHNFPEGLTAGIGFGGGDLENAIAIAGGIAIQNIPEGMVIIPPMLAAGISRRRTFFCAFITGLIEIIGTIIGYIAVSLVTAILPFTLAFAGGTMLYVVSDEMIPESHEDGRTSTYALLIGFCFMAAVDHYL